MESSIQVEEPTVLNYSRTIYNTFEKCVLDTCKTFLANTPSNVHPFIKKVCSLGVILLSSFDFPLTTIVMVPKLPLSLLKLISIVLYTSNNLERVRLLFTI